MRKTNPYSKFFTRGLYPRSGGIGDAFWAYHVSNNFGRLLNVDGTCMFKSNEIGWENYRVAYINMYDLKCKAVPIVQFTAVTRAPDSATVYAYGRLFNGTLDWDRNTLWGREPGEGFTFGTGINSYEDIPPELRGTGNIYFKVGTRTDELIMGYLQRANVTPNRSWIAGQPQMFLSWTISDIHRGYGPTTNQDYYLGEAFNYVSPTSWNRTILSDDLMYSVNPPFVVGDLLNGVLTIRWLHNDEGTVYFKIFGV